MKEEFAFDFVRMADFSVSVDDTEVGGLPAKVQTIRCLRDNCYFATLPQNRKEYYVKYGNMAFAFWVRTLDPEKDFSLLDQILSTFRFVK